jgi:MSHA biogenesis protein MshM
MTMYLEHFGLREAPFRITPHTEFFFAGANRGATLEALLYAITAGEGMVKVTGEVGTGKTMLCRVLMERLPDTVETIYLAVPSLSRDEMLAAIASDLDIDTAGANTTRLVKLLQEKLVAIHASGRQVVALIDEAHAMPLATLEEIRLLSNLETNKEKLLQIVLFGQPELDQHLALPNMRQLKERITHSFNLGPLPPREIGEYIRFRLHAAGYRGPDLFGAEALRIIGDASEGLTRRINIYADKTLLAAFAAGTHTVAADHARAAVSDTQIVVAARPPRRRLVAVGAGGLALGVLLGFGLGRWASPDPVPSPAAVAAAPAPAPPPPPPPAAGDRLDVVFIRLPEVAGVRAGDRALVAHPRDGDGGVETTGERDADALADGE